jgi:hypothetical protein
MLRNVILLALVLALFPSCKKLRLCKDGEFTFSRQEDNSNELKLSGYYYTVSEEYPKAASIMLLFRNGVSVNSFGATLDEVQDGIVDLSIGENFKNLKSGWGIYKIENGSIEIQSWQTIQHPCKPIAREKGKS